MAEVLKAAAIPLLWPYMVLNCSGSLIICISSFVMSDGKMASNRMCLFWPFFTICTVLCLYPEGEEHFNCISALHKSMRGSDENASLYWLGRMLEGGEAPLYVARRMVRFASEDVGRKPQDSRLVLNSFLFFSTYCIIHMPVASLSVYFQFEIIWEFLMVHFSWRLALTLLVIDS